jgi:hypothetical protein
MTFAGMYSARRAAGFCPIAVSRSGKKGNKLSVLSVSAVNRCAAKEAVGKESPLRALCASVVKTGF